MFDHTVLIAKHDPHLLTFRTMDSMKIIDLREVDQIGMEYFAEIATKKAHSLVYEPSSGRVRCEQTLVREHPMNAGVYIL